MRGWLAREAVEDRSGRERRNKWGPTQSCRERQSGRTLTTDASLARLASPRSFSLPPSTPPRSLSHHLAISIQQQPSRETETISLTLSVVRIRVWPLCLPVKGAIPHCVVSAFTASCVHGRVPSFSSLVVHFPPCCSPLVPLFLFLSLFSSFYPLSFPPSLSLFLFSISFFPSRLRSLGVGLHRPVVLLQSSFRFAPLIRFFSPLPVPSREICQIVAIPRERAEKNARSRPLSVVARSSEEVVNSEFATPRTNSAGEKNGEPRGCLMKGRSQQQIHERWRLSISQDQDQETLVLTRGVVVPSVVSSATMLELSRLRHAVVSR